MHQFQKKVVDENCASCAQLWYNWTMSKRDDNWIVGITVGVEVFYVKHPRGEITRNPDEAYGWHYKKDANREASDHVKVFVKRRKQCKS